MTTHEQLIALYETYVLENEKFSEKGIKASSSKARKALADFCKLAKIRRGEIQQARNEMK